ncbi:hypothetical protein L7F22_055574 [Adiantum nelumboides]|nr:hypothetical protein [Adiantum nelumboides]
MGDGDFTAAVVRQGDLSVAAGSLVHSTSVCNVPRLLAGALSGALTGVFAVVGAFTGAVTGALAGRATDSGLLRGAGLGAVAGAVLSVEVLEASRAYWYSEHTSSLLSSSVTEFLEDLLNGRFVQNRVAPSILNVHRWQVLFSLLRTCLYRLSSARALVVEINVGVLVLFTSKCLVALFTPDDDGPQM